MPTLNWTLVAFGCAGGLMPDILRIIQNRYEVSIPVYFKNPMFWVSLILLSLLGGFSAWFLEATDVKQALAYGFGAPEIISRVLGKIGGDVDRGTDRSEGGGLNLLTWWAA